MGETMLVVKEMMVKLMLMALCVADNRYPPMGSAIYYSTLKYASSTKRTVKHCAKKGLRAFNAAMTFIGKIHLNKSRPLD